MPTTEEIRHQIRTTLEQYFSLEDALQKLEKDHFRVCIFGSARIRPEDPTYHTVYQMTRMLAELGIDVVTGGGPGLMEAANRAVQDVNSKTSRSYGLPIHLPHAHELANKHLDIKSEHRRFSSRLDEFMRLSHAVVVAPGGIGTLLELVYVWQLVQVGMIPPRPIVLLDRSLWGGLLEWMREKMLGRGFISPGDFDSIHCADTPEEVLSYIKVAVEKFRAEMAAKPGAEEHERHAEQMLEQLKDTPPPPAESTS